MLFAVPIRSVYLCPDFPPPALTVIYSGAGLAPVFLRVAGCELPVPGEEEEISTPTDNCPGNSSGNS